MDELNKRYTALISQYNNLVQSALANPDKIDQNVEQIIQVNTQISTVLDEMIRVLTAARSTSSDMILYRDSLLQKLDKIQKEYNGLVQNSDKLETLRRIRAFEDDSWKRTLRLYLFAFIAIVVLIGVILIFKRKTQTTDITTAMPASPATMPALT